MSESDIAGLEGQLSVARVNDDPIARVDALVALAWPMRLSDDVRANALATEARQLAIKHGYKLGQARAVRILAMCVVDGSGMHSIFQHAKEALALFDEVGDDVGRAGARDFLSSLHEHTGDLATALEFALDALTIAERIDDPVRRGYALTSLGSVLAQSGDVEAGVERLHQAIRQFERVGETRAIRAAHSRLSRVLGDAGRIEEALVHAQLCQDNSATPTDHPFMQYTFISVEAKLAEREGRWSDAEALHRKALALFAEEPARSALGCAPQINLGLCLMHQGTYEEAEHELRDALARIEGNPVAMASKKDAHAALAELYEHKGDLASAIRHLREEQSLREAEAQREARAMVAQVKLRAEISAAEKDAEIHKLRYVELHSMHSKLVEAEKMAALGQLAAGAAHELHNPLAVVRSNASLMMTAADRLAALVGETMGAPEAEKLRRALTTSHEATRVAIDRVVSIVESLRRFTQLDEAERRRFDVNEGIESAMAVLAPSFRDAIQWDWQPGDVPKIDAWPRALNQAFLTVLRNAAEAIEGEGSVVVRTEVNGREVVVRICDTGRGMSQEMVDRLFDVAWSSTGARTKMRLGLTAAYQTVRKHGGRIDVHSELGRGTTVSFLFPKPSSARVEN